MAGIPIANKCLVMAAAGTKRPRPTFMAVVLGINISPGKKSVLLFSIHPGGHITKNMFVGVDKAMAGRDIPGWTDTNHPQSCAAREGLIDSLVQLGKGIAYVGKTVVLPP